jgi:hypothetical protein
VPFHILVGQEHLILKDKKSSSHESPQQGIGRAFVNPFLLQTPRCVMVFGNLKDYTPTRNVPKRPQFNSQSIQRPLWVHVPCYSAISVTSFVKNVVASSSTLGRKKSACSNADDNQAHGPIVHLFLMHSQHEANPFFDSETKQQHSIGKPHIGKILKKEKKSNDISSMGKHGDRKERQPNQTPQFSAFVPNRRPKRGFSFTLR